MGMTPENSTAAASAISKGRVLLFYGTWGTASLAHVRRPWSNLVLSWRDHNHDAQRTCLLA